MSPQVGTFKQAQRAQRTEAEQAVKEDGEVVIMCGLCGMDTFL